MKVLTDTQVIVQAYLGEPLPEEVQALLSDPTTERLISTVSLVEVAIKTAIGKMTIGSAEMQKAIRDLALTTIPFTYQHAIELFALPQHHRDPFDRMIIATALAEGIPLVSGDRQFKRYSGLQIIW